MIFSDHMVYSQMTIFQTEVILMDRQFLPFAGPGFGFNPFFRPFPHPFFPGRFLFPFFAFSPFFFPFFRGEDDRNDMCFAQYQVQSGDTLWKIAHMFNIPLPILEEANPPNWESECT